MPTARHQQQRQKEVGVQQTTAMMTPATWTQTPQNIYTPLSIPQTCGSVPRVHRGHPAKVASRGAAWWQNLDTGGPSKTSFTSVSTQRHAWGRKISSSLTDTPQLIKTMQNRATRTLALPTPAVFVPRARRRMFVARPPAHANNAKPQALI